jgi:hypothetical protein
MWMYVLIAVFFGAGYALGRFQHEQEGANGKTARTRTISSTDAGGEEGQGATREDQFGHLKPILVALHQWRGRSLDTAHMDALLELDDVASEETKRSRRARMVSDLNAWAWTAMDKPVLTRIRDEEDRRRTLYVIDHFDLPSWASPRSA